MNIAVCVKQVPDTAIEREGSGALGMAGVGASSDASLKFWGVADPGQRRHTRAEHCSTSCRHSDHLGTIEGVEVFWEAAGVPRRTP